MNMTHPTTEQRELLEHALAPYSADKVQQWAERMERNSRYATALMPDESKVLAAILRAYVGTLRQDTGQVAGHVVHERDGDFLRVYARLTAAAQLFSNEGDPVYLRASIAKGEK